MANRHRRVWEGWSYESPEQLRQEANEWITQDGEMSDEATYWEMGDWFDDMIATDEDRDEAFNIPVVAVLETNGSFTITARSEDNMKKLLGYTIYNPETEKFLSYKSNFEEVWVDFPHDWLNTEQEIIDDIQNNEHLCDCIAKPIYLFWSKTKKIKQKISINDKPLHELNTKEMFEKCPECGSYLDMKMSGVECSDCGWWSCF